MSLDIAHFLPTFRHFYTCSGIVKRFVLSLAIRLFHIDAAQDLPGESPELPKVVLSFAI